MTRGCAIPMVQPLFIGNLGDQASTFSWPCLWAASAILREKGAFWEQEPYDLRTKGEAGWFMEQNIQMVGDSLLFLDIQKILLNDE